MKTFKTIVIVFLLCILSSASAHSQSPVWKISKGENHLFIGGTIHVLSSADYPLPKAFDSAYKNSTILVLEADIQKAKTPEMQQVFMQKGMYQGKQQITQFLQPGTVQALETYLTSKGIPLEKMVKFKPGLLSVALLSIELQTLGLAGAGVDEFYNLKALEEKRPIVFLETVTEQLTFIAKMGEGREDEFIHYSLQDLRDLPNVLQALKNAWRNGDNARMQKLALKPLQDGFPKIYTSLVVDRNNNWLPRIETMLKTQEVELILVGSLHLTGNDGILKQLKRRGYSIENI